MLLKLAFKIFPGHFRAMLLATICLLATRGICQTVVTNFDQASMEAALTNGGTITFGTNGTVSLTSPLRILTNTTIDGSGFTITFDGGGISTNTNAISTRIFDITNNVTFTLANVTVANGRTTNGGGIYNAGGVVNLTNCVLSHNDAIGTNGANGRNGSTGDSGGNGGAGVVGIGGAIYNLGTLTIMNSMISNNVAFGGDGGNGGNGGNDSLFGGDGGDGGKGAVGWGGGIYNATTGIVSIINSTIRDNYASGGNGGTAGAAGAAPFPGTVGSPGTGGTGLGGGIYNLGTVIITNSTIMTNTAIGGDTASPPPNSNGGTGAAGNGGAVYNLGNLLIGNSTFTQNSSAGGKGANVSGSSAVAGNGGSGSGGAIYHNSAITNRIVSCTFATNNAIGGAGGTNSAVPANNGSFGTSLGGNIYRVSGQVFLQNTILAKGASGPNCSGTITDGGNNLSSDATPSNFPTAAKNKDAKLVALANNGGPTLTMALFTNSPAIDKGTNIFVSDQRGVSRPQGTNSDIGAFEFVPSYSISGRILEGTNGVPNIMIVVDSGLTNTTDANGNYSFFGLLTSNYVVTPTPVGSGFNPPSTNIFVGTNEANPIVGISVTNVNILANPATISSSLGFASTNNLSPTNVVLKLQFVVMPQRTYKVQASTNLTNWINISTNVSSTNGSFQFTFPLTQANRTNFPRRFFRSFIP